MSLHRSGHLGIASQVRYLGSSRELYFLYRFSPRCTSVERLFLIGMMYDLHTFLYLYSSLGTWSMYGSRKTYQKELFTCTFGTLKAFWGNLPTSISRLLRLAQTYSESTSLLWSVIQKLTFALNIPCSTQALNFLFHTSYPMIFSVLDLGGTGSQYTWISEAETERAHTLDGAVDGSVEKAWITHSFS